MDFGYIFANVIFKRLQIKIGTLNCFRLYSILSLIFSLMIIFFTEIKIVMIIFFIAGFKHQLVSLTSIHYITFSFPKSRVEYTGKVFMSSSFCMILLALSSIFIINPKNLPKSEKLELPNGNTEEFFSKDISLRIVYFFQIYGFLNFIFPLMCTFLLPKTNNFKDEENDKDTNLNLMLGDSIIFFSHQNSDSIVNEDASEKNMIKLEENLGK